VKPFVLAVDGRKLPILEKRDAHADDPTVAAHRMPVA
jgi:hypothetical protein